MKFRHTFTGAVAALFAIVPAASAHVELSTDTTTAGSTAIASFVVPHGCEGSATTQIQTQIPEGITEFKPETSSLWDVTMTTKKAAAGTKAEDGDPITDLPNVVTWKFKQPLADDNLALLTAAISLPTKAGQINFPTVQTCQKGTVSWTQIQAAGQPEPDTPAPSIMVTDKGGSDAMGGSSSAGTSHAASSAGSSDAASSKSVKDLKKQVTTARTLAIIGIALGAIGLLYGLLAMRRRRP